MDAVTQKVMFSSVKGEWATPQDLFDQLDAEFYFDLDAAADHSNHKCSNYFGPDSDEDCRDALAVEWHEWGSRIWCNPPYGRGIGEWVKKGYHASQHGCTVVMLLPARTDTKWFHDYCIEGEVRFIRGRVRFGGIANVAPFPSMVVVFRPPLRPGPYRWWAP